MKKLTLTLVLLVAVAFAVSPTISNSMLVETVIHHTPTGFVPLISGGGAGYYFWDSGESSDWAPTYSWIDASGGTDLGVDDDAFFTVTTPFAIRFCGADYASASDFYVGTNGEIGFSIASMNSRYNQDLPNASTPNNLVAIYWDDMRGYTGDHLYSYTDSGDDDLFVISYDPWSHYSGTHGELQFQAYFVENNTGLTINNTVVLQYQNPSAEAGVSATVGLENAAGDAAAQYSFNSAELSANLAIIFIDAAYVDNYIDSFNLLAPADGAEVVDGTLVTFDWEDATYGGSGNFYYEIALSENADLSSPFHEATGIAASTYDYTINQGNTSDVTVYWGVRAVEDTIGFTRNCSNIFDFTLHQNDYAIEETTWGQIKTF